MEKSVHTHDKPHLCLYQTTHHLLMTMKHSARQASARLSAILYISAQAGPILAVQEQLELLPTCKRCLQLSKGNPGFNIGNFQGWKAGHVLRLALQIHQFQTWQAQERTFNYTQQYHQDWPKSYFVC